MLLNRDADTASKPRWIVQLRRWAVTEPLIRRVYLFGSRARGDYRADSDYDLAIFHRLDPEIATSASDHFSARMFTWMEHEPRWQAVLASIVPGHVHLQQAGSDNSQVVWPSLKVSRIRLI